VRFSPLSVLVFLVAAAGIQAETWTPYPSGLPQFDYQGERLAQFWPQLMMGPARPFPTADYLQDYFRRYPAVLSRTRELAAAADAADALKAVNDHNFEPLAQAVQQVWRLHYEGRFKQARQLGLSLGPVGAIPGLYAQMMYATLIVSEPEEKLRLLREAAALSEQLLPLAADDAFARFGLAYARARILELLPTSEASASGYLGDTRDTLQSLMEENPGNPLYPAMLGGIHAGVVARVGGFLGRLTYGSSTSKAIAAFDQALANEPRLPVIYFEYARALGMIDAEKYRQTQQQLRQACLQQQVFSAEEALNQRQCREQLPAPDSHSTDD